MPKIGTIVLEFSTSRTMEGVRERQPQIKKLHLREKVEFLKLRASTRRADYLFRINAPGAAAIRLSPQSVRPAGDKPVSRTIHRAVSILRAMHLYRSR